ncbi:uncharacterized protein LOC134806289 [Cydia splendana]|uniref:uncharacterized protein LOC134806289 n=1 Tax=Cydia splendana TaxID=1100963 RepID=UPI002137077F
MSSDDYQVHNIYRYTRKTYKQNRSCPRDCTLDNSGEDGTVDQPENSREDVDLIDHSPRSDDYALVTPECLHDSDTQRDVTSILHKKCPVITLAQQQLSKVIEETNHMLSRVPEENCSALIRYICYCKNLILCQNKANYILGVLLLLVMFLAGLLFGAATCGTHYGQFNNPILNCIDSYFIPDIISIDEPFRYTT